MYVDKKSSYFKISLRINLHNLLGNHWVAVANERAPKSFTKVIPRKEQVQTVPRVMLEYNPYGSYLKKSFNFCLNETEKFWSSNNQLRVEIICEFLVYK